MNSEIMLTVFVGSLAGSLTAFSIYLFVVWLYWKYRKVKEK